MALALLVVVIWAFSWLLWRAYSVITTPNEVLVEKLGLDIPPTPVVTLEEISSREIQISWKHAEPSTSVQEHHIEVNGRVVGTTRKNEMGALISNLIPGHIYDIRVFCISAGTFQTPSAPLHVRLPGPSSTSSQDGSSESGPAVRAIPIRSAQTLTPLAAPAMTRELSGGQPMGRRGTTGRRPSPANHVIEAQDGSSKGTEDELDGDLAELSQRFQKVQQDIEAVEAQIQEEDKEFDGSLKELEARRDELKQGLKERDEASNDLRKQVHKAESASRTAQSEKTKKERLLQQKENQRRKRKDEIAKWEDQIASMKEEMAGIETQKTAIERRTQSELREVRKKIEEEQKEVAMLEEDNREKALQIKALEEERQQLNVEDETDETREVERLDRERDMRWRARFDGLQQTYARLWSDLQLANQQVSYTREQITQLETRWANSIALAPTTTLDMEALRRGIRPVRRPRHTNSHGSSISSPRGPFAGPEPFPSGFQYTSAANASPTTVIPSYFNPQNGMTLAIPLEIPSSHVDDVEAASSMPMSPRADALLPADLLGDESSDELPDTDDPSQPRGLSEAGTTPFPTIGSPMLQEDARRTDTPSAHSSSSKSFSSPLQTSAPAIEAEKLSDSGQASDHRAEEATDEDEAIQQPSKPKYMSMSSMFGLNRQRGKTLADQPPLLGSLKPTQSRSFPRNMDEFDPTTQPRRRLSYGGNWAFPGTLLRGNGNPEERDQEASRLSSTRRAFLGFGKSAGAPASYDPFAARSGSFDPGLRAETSSPRPSSTYSFDKLPRPSLESQFRAWNTDKPPIRNSPLAPDWGSLHSFSRSHSRRPSFVYGSTSNLSLPADEEVIEPDKKPSRPLQAPIGTRPASSQQASTPKLNPAAPSFTMLFGKRSEKTKDKSRAKDSKERVGELEATSPPESRKSKDTSSITNTVSTFESEPLDRTASATSAQFSFESTPVKPTFISKITRKASSNKFGSWKDKGGLFSRKEATAPNGENEEEQGSTEHLGKSLESTSTTPSAEDKKSSRSSLSNWNFMRKSKRGREDLTASEISESSERASETGEERDDDEA
ncbi:hypothetical protein A1O3_03840 [Capronia epimyces CBS 606.96]|uniref:Fibronectin type-III domain-containing protein n=1 Tax=Capronia epimyces CBS 606.96 TaxID=1182542 RepID=W9YCD5_9EURO|nr:uncharacterized protein A1O3_03840 [Capronia epimyces CBS 606.96]EXJ86886.1 hypothetical protein A1O3_03840 [Capronia epimyces CBS 606.96]